MAGQSDIISQEEIEKLLQDAQSAARGGAPATASSPPLTPAGTAASGQGSAHQTMDQPEIDSMLRGATATTTPQSPAAASLHKTHSGRTVTDDISFLLNQAEAALASVDNPAAGGVEGLAPFELQDFGGAPPSSEKATLELLRDVDLDVKIELGRSQMHLEDVLRLRRGSVVTLDKLAGDPVDIYVNGRLIARGEVLVLNDNFCVRVAELLSGEEPKAA